MRCVCRWKILRPAFHYASHQRIRLDAAMTLFDEPHFITTNGIRMAVYEQGAGKPVVLCH